MLLTGREPDDIAWPDLLHLASPTLHPAEASGDDQCLPKGMRMPCRTSARLECDACALHAGRGWRLKERIDPYCASEPVCRPFDGGLRTVSFDFHQRFSMNPGYHS
jgi:hypothetical protein